jgi:SAM-dependent methyltransferase
MAEPADPPAPPCAICERIHESDPGYAVRRAERDLGSPAPRCGRHWRYRCAACGEPAHFAAAAFCPDRERFFCATCAREREEVAEPVWSWPYAIRYRSPWSDAWCWALDRAEAEGRHPLDDPRLAEAAREAISDEPHLVRYPETPVQWWSKESAYTDEVVRAEWNANADRWHARYDADGDANRRYQSDPVLLDVLGDVRDLDVLDAGSGNGYLCRKLARAGARVVGVELSDRLVEIARRLEREEPVGVVYHRASISAMGEIPDACVDRVVSNYVLQDVRDLEGALAEIRRVLRSGGRFVCVVFHPCFGAGPAGWEKPMPDSPRPEDRTAFRVDGYFRRAPSYAQWGDLDPVLSFHRTLSDYWKALTGAGFVVEGIEEPSLAERGRRELPISARLQAERIAYSLVLDLRSPA